MEIRLEKKALDKLYKRRDRLDLNPEYQRGKVWSLDRQQLLMDTILRGWDIPKVYLRVLNEDNYECVDGQQRFRSVFGFYNNSYPLSKKYSGGYGGLTYSEMPLGIQEKFDDYEFSIVEIRDAKDEEVSEMFLRLQLGIPLNSAEKLNAMLGDMRNFVNNLAKHDFFHKTNLRNYRMTFNQVSAQITLLEFYGIHDVKFEDLKEMYLRYPKFEPKIENKAKKIKKTLNFLNDVFAEKTPEINNRASVVSLYLLASNLLAHYSVKGKENIFRDFFINFQTKLRGEVEKGTKATDTELILYQTAVIQAADSKDSIERRHEILKRRFFSYDTKIEPLDPTRGFTEDQKIAIYRRDKETCQICCKHVDWDDFQAHHKIPWRKGGKTTVENGQTTHKTCHQAIVGSK